MSHHNESFIITHDFKITYAIPPVTTRKIWNYSFGDYLGLSNFISNSHNDNIDLNSNLDDNSFDL